MTSILLLLVLVFCLGVSFVLSGMETGMPAVNRLRLRRLVRQGDKSARILHRHMQQPERFLLTILVGNAVATIVVMFISVYLLRRWLGDHHWLWLAGLLVVAFFLYALGDLLPKMLFRQIPTRAALASARFHGWIQRLLSPLVLLAGWVGELLLKVTGGRRFTGRLIGNREDLWRVFQESSSGLTRDERSMVNRVLGLQTLTVGALTVPLANVTVVREDTSLQQVLELCRDQPSTRLPVKDEETGRIRGYLSLSALLYAEDLPPDAIAENYVQAALFLRESDLVENALQQFRRTGQRFAIVTDGAGKEVGVMTLEDILRHIFGRLEL
jgi:CBS domain containing-hemolysin-like protein